MKGRHQLTDCHDVRYDLLSDLFGILEVLNWSLHVLSNLFFNEVDDAFGCPNGVFVKVVSRTDPLLDFV